MEELLSRQLALATLIENFSANTLKAGRANFNAGFLRSRRELLEKYWGDFQINHQLLMEDEPLAGDDYFTTERYSAIELNYTQALGTIYEEENRLIGMDQAAPVAIGGQHQRRTHLPRITLPTFSGRQDEWEAFRDMFRSLVHCDPELSGVQKLHYLKSCIRGVGSDSLTGLSITEANYAVAWDLLCSRYDDQQLLVFQHMSALAAITTLKSESSEGLQSLHDQITRHREALKTLNQPVASWDSWFVFFAARGMDTETRRDWEKKVSSLPGTATYVDLIAFLREAAKTLKNIEPGKRTEASQRPKRHGEKHEASNTRAQSTQFQARRVLATAPQVAECPACGQRHHVDRCASFKRLPIKDRRSMVRSARLCYNCLAPGHISRNCSPPVKCSVCSRPHHTLMHGGGPEKRKNTNEMFHDASTSKHPHFAAAVRTATTMESEVENPELGG